MTYNERKHLKERRDYLRLQYIVAVYSSSHNRGELKSLLEELERINKILLKDHNNS